MGIMDRARQFLGRAKAPKLSDRTVNCQRLDEGICRDMRRKATKLEEQFAEAPTVGDPEDPAAMREFGQWEDLLTDVFAAHHMSDEPQTLDRDKIKPSAELRRRLVQSYVNREEFAGSRGDTRMDELNSTFATVRAGQQFRESLDTDLHEHAERADHMERAENDIGRFNDELEALREQVRDRGGDATADQVAAMKALIAERESAREHLGDLVRMEQGSSMRADVAKAARVAAEAGEQAAQLASRLPGREPGQEANISADDAFDLAERWTGVADMWELAQMIGRKVQSMRADRRTRPMGGHDELVGVELGGDITRTIASELAALPHPVLRKKFMLDLVTEDLLQYEYEGHWPEDRGAIVAVKDGSQSMSGLRFKWATSACLALVHIGHDERRDVCVIEFGSPGQVKSWFFPKNQPINPMTVVECAEHFFAGGTSIRTGLEEARDVIAAATDDFASADIALITDGADTWDDGSAAIVEDLREQNVRILGVAIAHQHHEYLDNACEHVVDITDMALRAGADDATRFLATGIS